MKIPHLNHEKLIIIGIRVGLIGTLTTLGRDFPVQEISHPECEKGIARENLGDDCKISLGDKGKIPEKHESLYEFIYSALRGATYTNPHKQGSGSHPSLDIVSAEGTPVYAIQDGTVYKAGMTQKNGFGNSITIEHTFPTGEKVYSNYNHLKDITIKPGKIVKKGERIGTIGRSGFTIGKRGYHLDFQITTENSPSHPYGLHDCKKGTYLEVVNNGYCQDKLKKYTIDPVEFFIKHGKEELVPLNRIGLAPTLSETIVNDSFLTNANTSIFKSLSSAYIKFQRNRSYEENKKTLQNTQEKTTQLAVIIEQQETRTSDTLQNVPYDIVRTIPTETETKKVGKLFPVKFTIQDTFGNPINEKMQERMSLRYDATILNSSPRGFQRITDGKKNLFIKPLKAGWSSLEVWYGDIKIGEKMITVQ